MVVETMRLPPLATTFFSAPPHAAPPYHAWLTLLNHTLLFVVGLTAPLNRIDKVDVWLDIWVVALGSEHVWAFVASRVRFFCLS